MRLLTQICILFTFLLAVFIPAGAQEIDDVFHEEKAWQEIEVKLPAMPKAENFIAFKVGAMTDKQFAIDAESISIAKDGVIRFTLIITSSSGAQTISYEGLRCDTSERRVYAFGHMSEQRWSKARNNKWSRVLGGDNVYAELVGTYFCPVGASNVRDADDVRRVLRSK